MDQITLLVIITLATSYEGADQQKILPFKVHFRLFDDTGLKIRTTGKIIVLLCPEGKKNIAVFL